MDFWKVFGKRIFVSSGLILIAIAIAIPSCTHDPFSIEDPGGMPMDSTTIPMDTMTNPMDTTSMENPCDEDVVYFNAQILPILRSNCAFSGCHDAASAQDDVILESYSSVTGTADVQPFNLNDSEFYEVLVEDNPNKKMPPPPNIPLSTDQVNLIATWILQGAEDLECDEEEECNTDDVSYANDILQIIQTHCLGCHSGDTPSGGVSLSGYNKVKDLVDDGRLIGVLTWESGFARMPRNQDQLEDCKIQRIKSWIDNGALDN